MVLNLFWVFQIIKIRREKYFWFNFTTFKLTSNHPMYEVHYIAAAGGINLNKSNKLFSSLWRWLCINIARQNFKDDAFYKIVNYNN